MTQNIVEQARELAREMHKHQVRRESGQPFFEAHLEPVAQLVAEHGGSEYAIALAYCHDIVEDTKGTREDIEAISPELAIDVWSLTEEGETWEERKNSYKSKVPTMSEHALLVSICDKVITGRDFVSEWQNGKFGKRPTEIITFYKDMLIAYCDRTADFSIDQQLMPLLDEMDIIIRKLQELHP